MDGFNETEISCLDGPDNTTIIKGNSTHECWNLSIANSTDLYSCCREIHNVEDLLLVARIVFCLAVVSAGLLLMTLIVLIRIKSVQSTRVTIHKNLIASFILRFTIKSAMFGPYISTPPFGYSDWLCNLLFSLYLFSKVSNFSWMFVEGLHLHFILVMRPFRRDGSPSLLFYFIGWVVPCLLIICWVIVMRVNETDGCWFLSSGTEKLFINAPILFVLAVNLIILLNLIRIVIAKLCNENVPECCKVWQTIKSTIVLGFLLGTINIILLAPNTTIVLFLPYTQSVFVALYCITNKEIRKAIRRWWTRYRDSRSMTSLGYRGRFSRTSVTLVVTNQINTIDIEEGNTTELLALPAKDAENGVDIKTNGS